MLSEHVGSDNGDYVALSVELGPATTAMTEAERDEQRQQWYTLLVGADPTRHPARDPVEGPTRQTVAGMEPHGDALFQG